MPTDPPTRLDRVAGRIERDGEGGFRIVLEPSIVAEVTARELGSTIDPSVATPANVRQCLRRAARREFSRVVERFLRGWTL